MLSHPTAELKPASNRHRTSLLAAFIAFLAAGIIAQVTRLSFDAYLKHHDGSPEKVDESLITVFAAYDSNHDGVLDFEEFLPVARKLSTSFIANNPMDSSSTSVHDWMIDTDQEYVLIKAEFSPLLLESMSKFQSSFFQFSDRNIHGLTSWKSAAVSSASFPVKAFAQAFLTDCTNEVGRPWYIVCPNIYGGASLSSSRYHPPPLSSSKHKVLHDLLRMFHPNPFLHMRFAPQGTVASLRAQNQVFYDIMFRMHAEFQLNEPPDQPPFWFTPAQFLGQIIITKDGSHIQNFTIVVPTNQSLNVDMEWQTDVDLDDPESGTEVDIGYLPQMKLHSVRPSSKLPATEKVVSKDRAVSCKDCLEESKCGNKVKDAPEEDIKYCKREDCNSSADEASEPLIWDAELSREYVQGKIDETFYPFLKVPYVDLDEATEKAKQLGKLLHIILLWGALTDQSC